MVVLFFALGITAAIIVLAIQDTEKRKELIGVWDQYIAGDYAGTYRVTAANKPDSLYDMQLAAAPDPGQGITPSKGISNVKYDGLTWEFDSDWGVEVGHFTLQKANANEFIGTAVGKTRYRYPQPNRWVRSQ